MKLTLLALLASVSVSLSSYADSYITCKSLSDNQFFELGDKHNVNFKGIPNQVKKFFKLLEGQGYKQGQVAIPLTVKNSELAGKNGTVGIIFQHKEKGNVSMLCQWSNY